MPAIDPIKAMTETLKWIERSKGTDLDHLQKQGVALLERGQKSGTMKQWMLDHHATDIDALQVVVSGDKTAAPYGGWAPLDRRVDAKSQSGGVWFDKSYRDYKGMRVILSSPDALLVADDWHAILYVAASGVRP